MVKPGHQNKERNRLFTENSQKFEETITEALENIDTTDINELNSIITEALIEPSNVQGPKLKKENIIRLHTKH